LRVKGPVGAVVAVVASVLPVVLFVVVWLFLFFFLKRPFMPFSVLLRPLLMELSTSLFAWLLASCAATCLGSVTWARMKEGMVMTRAVVRRRLAAAVFFF